MIVFKILFLSFSVSKFTVNTYVIAYVNLECDVHYVVVTCRYGFKMMLDQVLMGEATTPGEFEEYLVEFDRDWYIGLEKEEDWKSSVLNSVPNLFSLGHNKAQVITKSTGENINISLSLHRQSQKQQVTNIIVTSGIQQGTCN